MLKSAHTPPAIAAALTAVAIAFLLCLRLPAFSPSQGAEDVHIPPDFTLVECQVDYSLNNPEILAHIYAVFEDVTTSRKESLELTDEQISSVVISGPFNVYAINDDFTVDQQYNEYFFKFGDDRLARLAVGFGQVSGNVTSTFQMVDDNFENVNTENHIVIGAYEEAYVISDEGVLPWGLVKPRFDLIDGKLEAVFKSELDVMGVIDCCGADLFKLSNPSYLTKDEFTDLFRTSVPEDIKAKWGVSDQ